jgi:coenzyme Q-binding protein COQ10
MATIERKQMIVGDATPYKLGAIPKTGLLTTVDELSVRAKVPVIFELAADVGNWPAWLAHYRFVRFRERARDGGGVVEMSASRPFGPVPWPTWWTSLMSVSAAAGSKRPSIRFRHVEGVTAGMEVEWSFESTPNGTDVRVVHIWNGPRWPVIGGWAARRVIGPLFIHGIASRTLAGLARVAEGMNGNSRRTPKQRGGT